MRITQGTFSFLPDLTDEQITTQIAYCQKNGWAVNIEFTDDPHPRNTYWELWGQPMFDFKDPAAVMYELAECRKVFKGRAYIRLSAFDDTWGWESVRIRSSPTVRKKSRASRWNARKSMAVRSATPRATYATDKPAGSRY